MEKLSSEAFLDLLEKLLKERNISKNHLCINIDIAKCAVTNWKLHNSLPSSDTLLKLANFFKVDPNFLIYGEIQLPEDSKSHPIEIFNRIWHLLLEQTGIKNPDYHEITNEQWDMLFSPLSGIAEPYEIFNWQFNRIMPTYQQLKQISNVLHKPLEYIAEGIDNTVPDYIPKVEISKEEYEHYKSYKQYNSLFWSYDAMYEPDKKYIAQLINRLFRLRRVAENRDFDFDYQEKHPGEIKHRDPNVSDEEYYSVKE